MGAAVARELQPGRGGSGERTHSLSPTDPKLTSCATNASICGDEARCVRTEKAAYCACRSGFHTVPGQPGCQGRKVGRGGRGRETETPVARGLSMTLPCHLRHQRVPALRHLLPALQQHQGRPSLQLRAQLHEDAQHLQGRRCWAKGRGRARAGLAEPGGALSSWHPCPVWSPELQVPLLCSVLGATRGKAWAGSCEEGG